MRCPEVMHELAAPTPGGPADPSALAAHLAACPACARWADDVARLDRAWDATRPGAPAGSFAALWTRVEARQAAAGASSPVILPMPMSAAAHVNGAAAGAGRRGGIGIGFGFGPAWRWAGLAAAAAGLLLAVLGPLRMGRDPGRDPAPFAPSLARFDAEPGETLIIQIAAGRATARSVPPAEVSETVTVAAELDILNFMESQDSL